MRYNILSLFLLSTLRVRTAARIYTYLIFTLKELYFQKPKTKETYFTRGHVWCKSLFITRGIKNAQGKRKSIIWEATSELTTSNRLRISDSHTNTPTHTH